MDAIEKRARELLDSSRERAISRKPRLIHMDDAIHAIIAALTLADKFEAQARAALEAAEIAQRRADRSTRTPPEGHVLVPVEHGAFYVCPTCHGVGSVTQQVHDQMLAAHPEAKS